MTPKDRFLYWIKERESIRMKKEAGKPKPWTDDPILRQYRFCNVRRMDDRVSQWLLHNWYEPNYDHPNMLLACTMARLFNNPDCLAEIGFPAEGLDKDKILFTLSTRKQKGLKNFRAAYIVSTNGKKGDKGKTLVEGVLSQAAKFKATTDSLEALSTSLMSLPGISTFMGGQISADARHALRGCWKDRKMWAPVGPGSRRGLNRLLGRPKKTRMKQEEFLEHFVGVRALVRSELPKIYKRLEAIDIQNCLCEFDKYERTLSGEGRPKQHYKGSR